MKKVKFEGKRPFKTMKKSLIIVGIVIIFIAAGAGVLAWQKQAKPVAENSNVSTTANDTSNQTTNFVPNFSSPTAAEEEKKIIEYQKTLQEIIDTPPEKSLADAPRYATEDEQIPGITITKKGDKKLVVNEPQGYSFEIPSFLVMARSVGDDGILFYNPKTMCLMRSCPAEISVFVSVNEKQASRSLDDFIRTDGLFNPAEKKIRVIGGEKASEFHYEEDNVPPQDIYFIARNNKIYRLKVVNDNPKYKIVTDSFQFIAK